MKHCSAFAVIILIPAIYAFLVVPMVANQKQSLLDDVNSRLQQTDAEIKDCKKNKINKMILM